MDEQVQQYVLAHTSPGMDVLAGLARETWVHVYAPQMMASPLQGAFLRMVSHMVKPNTVLELGTFTGYSAICLAQGLRRGGRLHTVEINLELTEIAARYFAKAGLSESIVQHTGDARDIVPSLDDTFDLIYLDTGKEIYSTLYELLIPKLKTGGFLLADNTLWYGKVADSDLKADKDTASLRQFNDLVQNDSRVENLLLPFEDGIMVVRKI